MSYATIMVHLQPGQSNTAVLAAADMLAQRHDARLVGIAATQPVPVIDNGYYDNSVTLVILLDDLAKETAKAEAEFRDAFGVAKHPVEWRSTSTCMSLADYITAEARCVDLILTSPVPQTLFNSARHVNVGELLLRAGGPVLVVPQAGATAAFDRIVIAWKDSREARRAVRDAIPLLKLATDVTIVEIADKYELAAAEARVTDVVKWLSVHEIKAARLVVPSVGDDPATLEAIVGSERGDLIVAGAYGHSRMREWAFGGVTRGLLRGERSALLSH